MGLGTSTENMVAKDEPVDSDDDFVVDIGDIKEKDDDDKDDDDEDDENHDDCCNHDDNYSDDKMHT